MNKTSVRDSGQAMAEFGITALVFFIMVTGLLDSGRAFWYYISVTEGARDCARYAITHGTRSAQPLTLANYDTVLRNHLRTRTPNLAGADLIVHPPAWEDGAGVPGTKVTIGLTYRFKPLVGLVARPFILPLRAGSTMIVQN